MIMSEGSEAQSRLKILPPSTCQWLGALARFLTTSTCLFMRKRGIIIVSTNHKAVSGWNGIRADHVPGAQQALEMSAASGRSVSTSEAGLSATCSGGGGA